MRSSDFHRIYVDACIDGIVLYEVNGFISKIFSSLRNKLMLYGAKRIVLPKGKFYWAEKALEDKKIG